jgi:zinc and cadmium transporter
MLWSIAASILVASVAFTARVLVWLPKRSLDPALPWLQSLAAGLLLGDAMLHMLPKSLTETTSFDATGQYLLLGILGLFAVECVIRALRRGSATAPFARLNIVGDTLHHFVDGAVIGASFAVNTTVGSIVTLAIMLHEMPREIGNAGILMAGGYTREDALLMTVMTTGAIPLGAIVMATFGRPSFLGTSLAIAAGTTLYLACSDLIPSLWGAKHSSAFAPPVGVGAGVALMWLAALLDH